jgi:simple sugar transport system permease protein
LPVGLRWVTGAIGPAVTTLIAFLMGGLVVVLTGKDPFKVYHAVFNGTGLNWFFHVGSYSARVPFATSKMWFPFDTSSVAAQNLQQTLLLTTPIILTASPWPSPAAGVQHRRAGAVLRGTIFAVWLGCRLQPQPVLRDALSRRQPPAPRMQASPSS